MKNIIFITSFIATITYNMNALAIQKCPKGTQIVVQTQSNQVDSKTKKINSNLVIEQLREITHQFAGNEGLAIKSKIEYKNVKVLGKSFDLKNEKNKFNAFTTIGDLNILALDESQYIKFSLEDKKGNVCQLEVMYHVAD